MKTYKFLLVLLGIITSSGNVFGGGVGGGLGGGTRPSMSGDYAGVGVGSGGATAYSGASFKGAPSGVSSGRFNIDAGNFKQYLVEGQGSQNSNSSGIVQVPSNKNFPSFNQLQMQQGLGVEAERKNQPITLKNYDTPAVKFIEKDRSEIVFDVSQPGVEGAARIKQRPEEFNGAGAAQVYEALKESYKTKEWAPVNQVQDLNQIPGIGGQLQQFQLRQVR